MRDGVCKNSSVRLPDLTADWEFGPHATLLKEARREGAVGRGEEHACKECRDGKSISGIQGRFKN